MTNLHHLSAVELSAKIKSKEVSSLELTELYISRIEKLDDKVRSRQMDNWNATFARTFRRLETWRKLNDKFTSPFSSRA